MRMRVGFILKVAYEIVHDDRCNDHERVSWTVMEATDI